MKNTIKDITEQTGLTRQGILFRATKLGITPVIKNRKAYFSDLQTDEIVNLNKNKNQVQVIYKPLHTYINTMIIPSKMNFLTLEQL